METTQWSGLKNELVGVETRDGPYVHLNAAGSELNTRGRSNAGMDAAEKKGGFANEVTEIDVAKREEPNAETEHRMLHRRFMLAVLCNILGLLLWTLFKIPGGKRAYDEAIYLYNRQWWYGPRQWRFWRREAWATPARFARPAARRQRLIEGQRRAAEGFYHTAGNDAQSEAEALRRARGIVNGVETNLRARRDRTGQSSSRMASPDVFEVDEAETLSVPYHQYLRGEVELEDDDDEEYVPEDDWGTDSEVEGDEGHDEDEDEDEVLLAHVNHASGSPMTRRAYAAIRSQQSPLGASTPTSSRTGLRQRHTPGADSTPRQRAYLSPTPQAHSYSTALTIPPHSSAPEPTLQIVAMQRRIAALEQDKGRDEWDDDRRKCCVVCTVEPRDTIFWPCRCLAVCNECRENLAERLSVKEHMCPCCRKK
jgi:hypothetical protein